MNDHEKIAAWNNNHSGSDTSEFVTRLSDTGLSEAQIIKVLEIVNITCLVCFNGGITCTFWRDE